MVIYLAGPYTEKNGHTVQDNIDVAKNIAVEVFEAGHTAITPHLNTANFENYATKLDYDDWLRHTMNMLRRCDAILLLPRWEESSGTIQEKEYAESVGMPVYIYPDIPPVHITEQRCPQQVDAFVDTIMKMYRTHLQKNADYSPANILGTSELGVVVRLWDKAARMMNLYGFNLNLSGPATLSPPREAKNESIDDTMLDMSVYAIINFLLRQGKWGI